MKSVFAGVRKSRLQGCSVREKGGCLCDNWKPIFLPLMFDWRTFSRRVTARGDVSQQKIKGRPIRTQEIGGVSLSDVLYERVSFAKHQRGLG